MAEVCAGALPVVPPNYRTTTTPLLRPPAPATPRRKLQCAAKNRKTPAPARSEKGSEKGEGFLSMGDFMNLDEESQGASLEGLDDEIGDFFSLGIADDDDEDVELADDLAAIFEREISELFPSPSAAARTAQEIRRARGLPTADDIEGAPKARNPRKFEPEESSSLPLRANPPKAKPPRRKEKKFSSSGSGLSSLAELGDFASLLSEAEMEMGGSGSPRPGVKRSAAKRRATPGMLSKPSGGTPGKAGREAPLGEPRKRPLNRFEKPRRPAAASAAEDESKVNEDREWQGFFDDEDMPVSMEEIFREMAMEMNDEKASAKGVSNKAPTSLKTPPRKPTVKAVEAKMETKIDSPLGPPRSPNPRPPAEVESFEATTPSGVPPKQKKSAKPTPKAATVDAPSAPAPPSPPAVPSLGAPQSPKARIPTEGKPYAGRTRKDASPQQKESDKPRREAAASASPKPASPPSVSVPPSPARVTTAAPSKPSSSAQKPPPSLRRPPLPSKEGILEEATAPEVAKSAQAKPDQPVAISSEDEIVAPSIQTLSVSPSPPTSKPSRVVPDEGAPTGAEDKRDYQAVSVDAETEVDSNSGTEEEGMEGDAPIETVSPENPRQIGPDVAEVTEGGAVMAPKPVQFRQSNALAEGECLTMTVEKVTKGGLAMRTSSGVSGFMPISQISPEMMTQAKNNERNKTRIERLRGLMGVQFNVVVHNVMNNSNGVINVLRPQEGSSAWARLKTDVESMALKPEVERAIMVDMKRRVWSAEVLSVINDGSSIVRFCVESEDGTTHEAFGLLPWYQLAFEGCEAEDLLPGDVLDVAVTNVHVGQSKICSVSKRATEMKLDVLQQRTVEDQRGTTANARVINVSQRVVTVRFELQNEEECVPITAQLTNRMLSRQPIMSIPDTFRVDDVLPVVVSGVSEATGECLVNAALLEPMMGHVQEQFLVELEVLAALRQPITARVLYVMDTGACLVNFDVLSMDNSRSNTVRALVSPPPVQYSSEQELKIIPPQTPAIDSDIEVEVVTVDRKRGRVRCRVVGVGAYDKT